MLQLDLEIENTMAEAPDNVVTLEAEIEAQQILEQVSEQCQPAVTEQEQQRREALEIEAQWIQFLEENAQEDEEQGRKAEESQ